MRPVQWAQRVTRPDSGVSKHGRLVALALAVHSTGTRFPWSEASTRSIVGWSGLGPTAVKAAISELVAADYLTKITQRRKNGGQDSNRYCFIVPDPLPLVAPRPAPQPHHDQPPAAPRPTPGRTTTSEPRRGATTLKDKDLSKDADEHGLVTFGQIAQHAFAHGPRASA